MQKNKSEILFEEFCRQRQWKLDCLDNKYPNIKTPDYLVTIEKSIEFYAEIKEISNKRKTDQIANRNRIFTLSKRRLFGTIEDDIRKALNKINEFSESKVYRSLPFVFIIINVNQAFIDTDIELYRSIFDNFENSELLSAFGFLNRVVNGQMHRYYLNLTYNPNSKYSFNEGDRNYLESKTGTAVPVFKRSKIS